MKKLYSFNTRVILGIYRSFYLNTTRLMEDGKIGLKKNICKSFLYQVCKCETGICLWMALADNVVITKLRH